MDSKPDISGLRIDHGARATSGGWKLGTVVALVLATLLGIGGFYIVRGRPKAEVEVSTARSPAAAGTGAAVLNASGYVTPRRKATVAAKITGRVMEMLVDEGMAVEAGQVLARLDDAELRAQLEVERANREVAARAVDEAEVTRADAERTLWRARELREKGFATQEDLDRASTALDASRARLALSRQQHQAASRRVELTETEIGNCTVRAPFAGVAISKDAQPGEIVSPMSAGGGFTRTGISTIVDMSSLEIEVDVNESFIARVKPGQPVDAILDAYPDWHIPAKVRTTIPAADRQKATVKVRISFDALDPRILPDMGVKVAFMRQEDEQERQAQAARALVPKDAVRDVEGKRIVFVVKEERLDRREVTTGFDVGPDIEIMAGVSPGEPVVVGGPEELADGQRVVVKQKT
ncbi:MAG: efflux RND transporter periplasmic adaptor subunit [Acidobacteria bacterium]|nr:efflux RND transporter periplasmic adaptor subunit [Acidobacteriota bacterium]